MVLNDLHIEDRPEAKYSTKCPQCADKRSKTETKSLMVYRDADGIRYECMHPGCDWYKNRQFIKKNTGEVAMEEVKKIEFRIPLDESMPLPKLAKATILYPYKDVDCNILFYIARKDISPGRKTFFPLAQTEDSEWVMKRPTVKCLYGAENLNKDQPVIIVEGEKTKDAAEKIFTTATIITWAGGASSISMGDWELLNNREVIVWPDNDAPGIMIAKKIASILDAKVSLVDPSSLPPKADLADDLTQEQIMRVWETRYDFNRPEVTGSYSGDDLLKTMEYSAVGEEIGWSNMQDIRLPASGVVIVEGRSGHGKTTMMVNLMAKKIQAGKGPLVFYSYEMPARRIILKLVAILDGRELDPIPYKNEEKYREEIRQGKNRVFKDLKDRFDKDIFITDSYIPFNKLLSNLASPHMDGAFVFLDYIQYIPSEYTHKNRYVVLKEFSDKIQNISHNNNIVVFAGAQLTPGDKPRMDSPRESRDIHNVAELVLRIWNTKQGQAMGVKWDEVDDLPGDSVIEVRKNRNGFSGVMYCFKFEKGCQMNPMLGDF